MTGRGGGNRATPGSFEFNAWMKGEAMSDRGDIAMQKFRSGYS